MSKHLNDMEAWKDLRYGMFIHWGLYALMGCGEWAMFNEGIDKDEYRKLMADFTAEKFDATAWARLARQAGMKYMVLVTRHHDGFALWDSPSSAEQFTSMHAAAHRDFVREFTDACRAEGLKVGLYYSPMDWRFPGYFFPRMYHQNALEMRRQCHEQIRELMTQYGKIDIFWYDGGEDYWLCHGLDLHKRRYDMDEMEKNPQCPDFWGAKELDAMIREMQPGIVINNRSGRREFGDYLTPEGYVGKYNVEQPWETNMTINGSWGWTPTPPRSRREIIRFLANTATGDGNFLLNVGPRADGEIEPEQANRLMEVGAWLEKYGESIYGTRGGPFINSGCGGMCYRGQTLYIHVWDWKLNSIVTPALKASIQSVVQLTGNSLQYTIDEANRLHLTVSADDQEAADTVIRVELDRPVRELVENIAWCEERVATGATEAIIVKDM